MKKTLLLCLILAAVVCGCKKYEDGPLISFRSAYSRMDGAHTLTKYTVDGVDSLSHFKDSLGTGFNFEHIENHKDMDINIWVCDIGSMAGKHSLGWVWTLTYKHTALKINSSSSESVGTGPFGNNKTPTWSILELKMDVIKMKTDYCGKTYEIELDRN